MPVCRHCGSRITKFDKDICPICGEKNPLEGVGSETVDITSNFDLSEAELKNFHPKTRFRTLMLFAFLGWTGAPMFYLNYLQQAIIWVALNVILIAGVGSALAFFTPIGIILGYVIAFIISYAINIACGVFVYYKHNLKDGRGEFLR